MPFPKVNLSSRFKRAVIMDVETGGFSRDKNPLLEVGALLVDHELNVVDSFHTYVVPDPALVVDPGAAEVNGYKPELWGIFPEGHVATLEEEAAVYRPMCTRHDIQAKLLEWVSWRDDEDVRASAFNAPFDKAWIAHYAPKFIIKMHPDWICSMQALRNVYKSRGIKVEKGMTKLSAVCDGFQYEAVTGEKWARHTALDDCYAARFVMAVAAHHNALG